ncbi:MAG: DNA helicase II [Pseudomonadota bacterium]|nr:DNA helicase II [Pseudomonadota bacterium]
MDVTHILENLNDQQREAVTSEQQNIMVLAGAGSGKTRVLVHKVAWQIEAQQFSPSSIMAVTFTNKAANEMRSRIEELLEHPSPEIWCGTFHSLSHRILRKFHKEANLAPGFTILDSDDQLRIVKRLSKEMNLDDAKFPPRQSQWMINNWKDDGKRSKDVKDKGNFYTQTVKDLYIKYEQACAHDNLVDFAELILLSYEIIVRNSSIRDYFFKRFDSILIDEFQDTNTIQYKWLQSITAPKAKVTAVGDDDQSIYGWRGAKVENVKAFSKDFKDVHIIKLEQNYRSTNKILSAANTVIQNNSDRLGKNLWTESLEGDNLTLYAAFNEQEEARFIASSSKDWMDGGGCYEDIAILYRSNAQSRALEEAFLRASIPYRIYGGLRFYDRLEIKNAVSYLRVIFNNSDNPAFERSISNPTRGVGAKTLEKIRTKSTEDNLSYLKAAATLIDEGQVKGKGATGIKAYLDFILETAQSLDSLNLSEIVENINTDSGLYDFHKKEPGEKGKTRTENLDELVSAAKDFELSFDADHNKQEIVEQFLDNISLDAGDRQADAHEDAVQLMTLHSAKGLEFKLVFLTGMEESLFPHGRSMESPAQLEEERRLCYVGITRAMQKLYLTYAESRRLHGTDIFNPPSRFLKEIPAELIDEIRPRAQTTAPYARKRSSSFNDTTSDIGFSLGDKVSHPSFGDGIVLNYEGVGESASIQINFEAVGTKWLMLSFAKLKKVS